MNRFLHIAGIALYISFACIMAGCGGINPPHPASSSNETANTQTRTITDSIGRQVVLPRNISRAAITNAYNAELITAIGAADKIAGVDYYIYQDQEGFKNRFTENMLIGSRQGGLNYEKIADMNPDVLIICENDSWETAQERLRPFGIPVVVCNSYYTSQFAENTALLGQIFGMEKNAEELSSFFLSRLDYIDKQLKDVPRRSVYFEYRTPGRTTIPGDYFYEMIEKAHADNIFKTAQATQIQIEDVVHKNPAFIVKVSDANVYSSYIPPKKEDMEKIWNDICLRPGWSDMDAIKQNHILLLSHYAHGGASKLVGTMYIAKFLYPDKLPDLHPEEVFKKWVTVYEGLEYQTGHTFPAYELND